MSSVLAFVLLVAGVLLVVAGAETFFSGLLGSADRLRLSPFAVAAVVSGFELENLAAGIVANLEHLPGAAAGTFLGGTSFLALGVAGLGALISPIRTRLPRAVLLWTALAPVPLVLVSTDGEISRLDGAVLIAWFLVAMLGVVWAGRSLLGVQPARKRRRPVVALLAGLAVLSLGGELLGEGLRRVVSKVGISDTLLGNTAVAASVEAEEVARVAVPVRHGRPEIALANVAGTIVHFVALNAGVIALVRPLSLDAASRHLHLPVAAASTLLFSVLLLSGRGLRRREGVFLLSLYAAYVAAAVVVAAVG